MTIYMYRVIPSEGFESYILNGIMVGLNWVYFPSDQGDFSFLEKQVRTAGIYYDWNVCPQVFAEPVTPVGTDGFYSGPTRVPDEDRGNTGEDFFAIGQCGRG